MTPDGIQWPTAARHNAPCRRPGLSAWRFVVSFGVVSLLMDLVYESARAVTGPLLAGLGASALLVGAVTGTGEAAALGLRLVAGPLTDRTGRFWTWTITGYAITAVTVPFLGLAGVLWVACVLVIAERVGKAVRSPAKDTLVSHATGVTGRGRGFAVHEALDQVGALAGPLAVAGVLAATGGSYSIALGLLAFPGAAALVMLLWLRARVPDPAAYEDRGIAGPTHRPDDRRPARLPRAFWLYAAFVALALMGFGTFGVLSFHLVQRGLAPVAVVPVIYAAAMAVDALAALVTGWWYDRVGGRAVIALPVLMAAVPPLAFANSVWPAVAGVLLWGAALGIQESTLRAVVADLVQPGRRATAYGVFAGVTGAAALVGGVLTGGLYEYSTTVLIVTVLVIQAVALGLFWATLLGTRWRPDLRNPGHG